MRRREEKRRKLHEALLQTLYPHSSSSSPSPEEIVDEEPFDVTLINPEDYLKIDSSNNDDDNENSEDSETIEKQSRSQRKRVRKKKLKEEAARRRKVIGPLLPAETIQTSDVRVADVTCCIEPARQNAQEKDKLGGNDMTSKTKKRREAKKLAKENEIS
ncbi:unnamed protein product [Cochlearia groenlandica]